MLGLLYFFIYLVESEFFGFGLEDLAFFIDFLVHFHVVERFMLGKQISLEMKNVLDEGQNLILVEEFVPTSHGLICMELLEQLVEGMGWWSQQDFVELVVAGIASEDSIPMVHLLRIVGSSNADENVENNEYHV